MARLPNAIPRNGPARPHPWRQETRLVVTAHGRRTPFSLSFRHKTATIARDSSLPSLVPPNLARPRHGQGLWGQVNHGPTVGGFARGTGPMFVHMAYLPVFCQLAGLDLDGAIAFRRRPLTDDPGPNSTLIKFCFCFPFFPSFGNPACWRASPLGRLSRSCQRRHVVWPLSWFQVPTGSRWRFLLYCCKAASGRDASSTVLLTSCCYTWRRRHRWRRPIAEIAGRPVWAVKPSWWHLDFPRKFPG